MQFEISPEAFVGPNGSLSIDHDDDGSLKLAMLMKGECGPDGPSHAAKEFGFSRQRYFQLRTRFHEQGAAGLLSHPRGPKTNYRRTREVVCQVVRYRFLDPDVSSEVIAQKLRQSQLEIRTRSEDRILAEFGLQKKLYQYRPDRPAQSLETFRTRRKNRAKPADAASLERGDRQLLADRIRTTTMKTGFVAPWLHSLTRVSRH